jgi:hypothetical protein
MHQQKNLQLLLFLLLFLLNIRRYFYSLVFYVTFRTRYLTMILEKLCCYIFDTTISTLEHFNVRAIWILFVGSNRFLCFVSVFSKVEHLCSLSLLRHHYPQEFNFYPTWGNLVRIAYPW